jgi:hypothetical protein
MYSSSSPSATSSTSISILKAKEASAITLSVMGKVSSISPAGVSGSVPPAGTWMVYGTFEMLNPTLWRFFLDIFGL